MLKNPKTRFLVLFIVTVVVLYSIVAVNAVNDKVVVPYTNGIARAAGGMLRAIGEPVTVTGTVIHSMGFAVNVENGCNGIEAVILLIAAIGAFPAKWTARLFGILAGFVIIQVINLFRVAMLYWLGAHHPKVFQLFHVAVWQSLIILLSVGLFLLWSWKFAKPRPLADAR